MDESLSAELRGLRARAYGPHADIQHDPEALRRLQQLESWSRTPPRPPDPPAAQDTTPSPSPQPPSPDSPEAEPPPPAPPAGRRRRGRIALVWIASVVAAGLAGAAAALLVPRATPEPVATLAASDDAAWPGYTFGDRPDGAVLFDEHLGVQIVAVPQEAQGGSAMCLYAMSAEDLPRGAFAVGCGAGPFPPTVTSLVSSDWPPQLRARFAVGSAVRYVLEGDRVLMYAAPPATVPPPSP